MEEKMVFDAKKFPDLNLPQLESIQVFSGTCFDHLKKCRLPLRTKYKNMKNENFLLLFKKTHPQTSFRSFKFLHGLLIKHPNPLGLITNIKHHTLGAK